MIKRTLLMTVATVGLFSTTYGAGDEAPFGQAAMAGAGCVAVHADLAANPQVQRLIAGMGETYRTSILEILKGMGVDQVGRFFELLNPMIEGLEGVHKVKFIYSFGTMLAEEREGFIATVKPLIELTEREVQLDMLCYLAELPKDEWVRLIDQLMELFQTDMNESQQTGVIWYVSRLPDDEQYDFLKLLNTLTAGTQGEGVIYVADGLAKVPALQRAGVAAKAPALFGDEMDGSGRKHIITWLANMPAGDHDAYIAIVSSLTVGLQKDCRLWIMSALAEVPASERLDASDKASALFTEKMPGNARGKLIKAMAMVPPEERLALIKTPLVANIYSVYYSTIISTLLKMTYADRQDYINLVAPFLEGIKGKLHYRIMRAFYTVPAADRSRIGDKVTELLKGLQTNKVARVNILMFLVTVIPSEKQVGFRKSVEPFIDITLPLIKGISGENRFNIIRAMVSVRAYKRQDVAEKAIELFGNDIDGFRRSRIIEILGQMGTEDRAKFVAIVSPLITEIPKEHRFLIIQALAKVPAAERAEVASATLELFDAGLKMYIRDVLIDRLAEMSAVDRSSFLESFCPVIKDMDNTGALFEIMDVFEKLPAAERAVLTTQATRLYDSLMDEDQRFKVFKVLARIPAKQRQEFFALLLPLIEGTSGSDRLHLIQNFAAVPAGDREVVRARAVTLFDGAMRGVDQALIIEMLNGMPDAERLGFVETVKPLIEGMEGANRSAFADLFAKIPAVDRAVVAAEAASLFGAAMVNSARLQWIRQVVSLYSVDSGLFDAEMIRDFRANLIEIIIKMPEEERGGFVTLVSSIVKSMEKGPGLYLIKTLATVPADRRAGLVATSKRIYNLVMAIDEEKRSEVTKVLASLDFDDREEFVRLICPLIKDIAKTHLSLIIDNLAAVPAAERTDVAAKAAVLFDAESSGYDRAQLINLLGGMSAEERAGFVIKLMPLIEGMEGVWRSFFALFFGRISVDKRELVAREAAILFSTLVMDNGARLRWIRDAAHAYAAH